MLMYVFFSISSILNIILIYIYIYQTNIHQTQEIIELILDSSRNSLLALDLQVSIATMGIATGTLVAGFFGMNVSDRAMKEHASV